MAWHGITRARIAWIDEEEKGLLIFRACFWGEVLRLAGWSVGLLRSFGQSDSVGRAGQLAPIAADGVRWR